MYINKETFRAQAITHDLGRSSGKTIYQHDSITAIIHKRPSIHLLACVTGNGGPPGKDSFHEHCPGLDCKKIPATRVQSLDVSENTQTLSLLPSCMGMLGGVKLFTFLSFSFLFLHFITPCAHMQYGYGRLIAHNASCIEFWQFENAKQSEVDHFVITQNDHVFIE